MRNRLASMNGSSLSHERLESWLVRLAAQRRRPQKLEKLASQKLASQKLASEKLASERRAACQGWGASPCGAYAIACQENFLPLRSLPKSIG